MALTADFLLRRGDFTLDARLRVNAGETFALLGPNGSGKSTMLAVIAGLLMPERGTVEVNGRTLTRVGADDHEALREGGDAVVRLDGNAVVRLGGDAAHNTADTEGGDAAVRPGGRPGERPAARSAGRSILVASHERRVGLLGQDPLLFPHLTALENVAFGARSRGDSTTIARASASAWLEAVGLHGFDSRLPTQLSGGQQQRVAIARALAAAPDVLLLDEPMAALDVQNAASVRTLLRERLAATALPTIVVSHDVVDAMVLADRVAIMHDGRILDVGDPATVLGQPTNQFAANLVGLNLLHGTLGSDGSVHVAGGRMLRGEVVDHAIGSRAPHEGDEVIAAFPPSAVRIVAEGAPGQDGLSWRVTVGLLEPAVRGIRIPFVGESFAAELTTTELLSSGVREGMSVTVTVNPVLVTVYRPRAGDLVMEE